MGFASAWLEGNTIFPRLILAEPDPETGIIIVIPSYGEGNIGATVDSIAKCTPPACRCEVIVVVNAPADAPEKLREENKRTISYLNAWSALDKSHFRLFLCTPDTSHIPGWGVGHARKTGMDEAVRRFNQIDNPGGVIASLDADCIVNRDYLTGLFESLYNVKGKNGCTITLYNGRNDEIFPEEITTAALKYELERRYMFLGFRYAGYPWCFNIYGSAMAFRAGMYVKSGGMNKRQAGEDFWFMRKILPAGGFFHNNISRVYASARVSARVPFGTGRSVRDIISSSSDARYFPDIEAFNDLKRLWDGAWSLYKKDYRDINNFYDQLPAKLKGFISAEKFIGSVLNVSANTATPVSFARRYFITFDLLYGLRYLNCFKEEKDNKKDFISSCVVLAQKAGFTELTTTTSLSSVLSFYRGSEAWISCSPF